jgi:hypothetical protein
MQVELFHALQLILFVVIVMSFSCKIVHSFKFTGYRLSKETQYSEVKTGLSYSTELTVVNYVSYHMYQIWRFYLFS